MMRLEHAAHALARIAGPPNYLSPAGNHKHFVKGSDGSQERPPTRLAGEATTVRVSSQTPEEDVATPATAAALEAARPLARPEGAEQAAERAARASSSSALSGNTLPKSGA
eukprot:14654287-Alexandrium_andersonii.AAC.1